MTSSRPDARRKLAAILHADVVGFSGRMAADESGVHAELAACMELAHKAVAGQEGRIVGTAGDAFLADFGSASQAVAAALAFQNAVAKRAEQEQLAQPLVFRVGVNLGDVIVDGSDIFGDGVNVAARIQALAEPGGIAASAAVRDLMRTRSGLAFDDLGLRRVKNIPEPIRVYAVRESNAARPRAWRPRRRALALAAAGALVLLVGAVLMVAPPLPTLLPASDGEGRARSEQAAEPTIAVLPFDDRAASEDTTYFSAGVTEDLISALGRFSGLQVLSWSAVAPFREQEIEPAHLGDELDVRYLVSGSIRRGGDRLRIAVHLAETERGTLLWSETYKEPLTDVFALQDRISRAVADALSVELTQIESRRAFETPPEDLAAYDRVLQGRSLMRRTTRDANLDARALFQEALAIDPSYAAAHVGAGWTHMNDLLWGWSEWPGESLEEAGEHATAAVEHDPRNARAHALLGAVLRFRMELERAEDHAERAIALNPSDPMGHAVRGGLLLWAGELEEARAALETAVRLDPNPPTWFAAHLAQAYFLLGRHEDALRTLDRVGRRNAEDPVPHALRAATLAELGRDEEAAREVEKVKRLSPFFDARAYASALTDPAQAARLVDGLQDAGL